MKTITSQEKYEQYKNEDCTLEAIGLDLKINGSAIVNLRGRYRASVEGDSKVRAYGEGSVYAYDRSQVIAHENCYFISNAHSQIHAVGFARGVGGGESLIHAEGDGVHVKAKDRCTVVSRGARITALDKAKVTAYGNSMIQAYDDSAITARNECYVFGQQRARIQLFDNSMADAVGKCIVCAYDSSYVRANGAPSIQAHDFAIVRCIGKDVKLTQGENFFGRMFTPKFVATKDFIAYKALRDGLIATLMIKKGTPWQSIYGKKCRAERAFVLAIEGNGQKFDSGVSQHNMYFPYKVGEEVVAENYENDLSECDGGIHFYLKKSDAEAYS